MCEVWVTAPRDAEYQCGLDVAFLQVWMWLLQVSRALQPQLARTAFLRLSH